MTPPTTDSSGQLVQPRMITHVGDGATPLTNRDIAADLKVLTDLKKGASDSDNVPVQASNVLESLAKNLIYVGPSWERLMSANAKGDGAGCGGMLPVVPFLANGSNWDRQYNNREIQLLASALRTPGEASSPVITAYNHRGLVALLNITARTVGAAPSLTVYLFRYDPGIGSYDYAAYATFDPVVGKYWFVLGQGAAALVAGSGSGTVKILSPWPLPRRCYFYLQPNADVTDLTYSLGAVLTV